MEINLTAIYISNLMAVVLILFMCVGTRWRVINDRLESICIRLMVATVFLACVTDTLAFTFDGKDGFLGWFFPFIGNGLLFCLNMVIGPAWSTLVIHHVRGRFYKYEKIILSILSAIGFILLIINLFTPLVFHVDANHVYHRDLMYWYFLAMELLFMIYGSVVYIIAKARGGVLKFFPVVNFIIPILIGLGVQTVFYGISTIPPFIAVSMSCMISSLQNENIYRDSLTGIYNRAYLDFIKTTINKKSRKITAIMLDMNNFKSINDRYGHKLGDEALIDMALILRRGTGDLGNVIRYAGDEFVVLLNTSDEAVISNYILKIKEDVGLFNETASKKYQLSYAIGYYSADLRDNTVDEILNEVDRRMYQDKESFYKTNPEFDRRKD